MEVVRGNSCAADDTAWSVEIDAGTAWPPLVTDGGATAWHAGPSNQVTVTLAARSPMANVNGTGQARVTMTISLALGRARVPVVVRAPSGRVLVGDVVVVEGGLLAGSVSYPAPDGGGFGQICYLNKEGSVFCTSSGRLDAGTFVSLNSDCALRANGEAWCFDWLNRTFEPIVVPVADVVAVYREGFFTREGAFFTRSGAVVVDGGLRSAHCEFGCCFVSDEGTPSCDSVRLPPEASAWPGRYGRVMVAGDNAFAQLQFGPWFAGTDNSFTVPFGLQHLAERSSATSIKIVSPDHCQLWLEADGGAWINPFTTPRTFDAGTDVIVDVGVGNGGFVLLTAERELRFADCSL